MADESTSPSVTQLLGAAGACPEIVHDGKTWRVGHPTQRAKAALEVLVTQQALAQAKALGDKDALARFDLRNEANHYRTWGPGWQTITFDPSNSHLFFASLLRELHPEASVDDAITLIADHPEEVQSAVKQVAGAFFLYLVNSDKRIGKAQKPAVLESLNRALVPLLSPTPSE